MLHHFLSKLTCWPECSASCIGNFEFQMKFEMLAPIKGGTFTPQLVWFDLEMQLCETLPDFPEVQVRK